MENNYYIKKNYTPNLIAYTIDKEKEEYWNKWRTEQALYYRYYFFKNCRKLIKKKKLKSVLDIGCGPAFKLMKVIYPACKDVYGIDQERIIKQNKKKYDLNNFYSDDIENSKLELKKEFDLIISSDVIEHLMNPNNLINLIKKYCHDNTYIAITTPERDIIRGKNCNYSPNKNHVREWNNKEFHNYISNSGFKIIFHEIIENYKISYILKNTLDFAKRFNSLEKIWSTQLIICKLEINDNSNDKTINKIFRKSKLRDALNLVLLQIRLLLLKFYEYKKLIFK